MTLLERFQDSDIRALARLITVVENRDNGYRELLAKLYNSQKRSLRIGFTGPPGAGKSTLVNTVASKFLKQNNKVGVIAVDPSSPFSGGALLGDRVRMTDFPTDGSFYFRSMATRGASGGLAGATDNACIVYDAFGFDITLIETVGVGQVELDIIDSCDVVVVILVPESGDAVQTMKAGLMEIADIFCVNKADRPGAERIVSDLKLSLETRKHPEPDQWLVPIISTEAINSKNIDELVSTILKFIEHGKETGQFAEHRRRQLKKKIYNILKNRFQREFLEKVTFQAEIDDSISRIQNGDSNPFAVADQLYKNFTG